MSSDLDNVHLSEINLKFNNKSFGNDRTLENEDTCEETIPTNSDYVNQEISQTNSNRKYVSNDDNNTNLTTIHTNGASHLALSQKEKKDCSSTRLDCSKQSLVGCFRDVTTKARHLSTCAKCVIVLSVVVFILLIVVIILASNKEEYPDKTIVVSKTICDYNLCMNNGSCLETDDRFSCHCLNGYSGKYCQDTACDDIMCLNGGFCQLIDTKGVCVCPQKYSGLRCEVTPCTYIKCHNGGICKDIGDGNFECNCLNGTSGTFCEATPCDSIQCLNGGTCLFTSQAATCTCPDTFYGEACENVCQYGTSIGICTFEDGDDCFLTNDTSADFLWNRNTGPTPSRNTGPKQAKQGQHYMYMESSSPVQEGQVARLISKREYSVCLQCMRFSYHMYGLAVGKLYIFFGENVIWSKVGSSEDSWNNVKLDINETVNKHIIVEAVRGNGITGDIAIDEIVFTPGKCN